MNYVDDFIVYESVKNNGWETLQGKFRIFNFSLFDFKNVKYHLYL